MNVAQVKLVHNIIKMHGDSFWREEDNEYLFDEVLEVLRSLGYTLKLICPPNQCEVCDARIDCLVTEEARR